MTNKEESERQTAEPVRRPPPPLWPAFSDVSNGCWHNFRRIRRSDGRSQQSTLATLNGPGHDMALPAGLAAVSGGWFCNLIGRRILSQAHVLAQNLFDGRALGLDALEQSVRKRRPATGMGLVHHSDRGSRHLFIRYTERIAEAGIELRLAA